MLAKMLFVAPLGVNEHMPESYSSSITQEIKIIPYPITSIVGFSRFMFAAVLEMLRFSLFGNVEPLERHSIPQEVNRIEKAVKDVYPSERKNFLLLEFFELKQRLRTKQVIFYYTISRVSEEEIGGAGKELVTLISGHHSVVIAVWNSGKVLKTHTKDGAIHLERGVWRSLID